ncbi:MAG: bifunctional glycosyltransferase family 2 protein/CDP-glycerol:glycerophosphate glycerophosphotransferase [Eubacterium sp.]|nr:bifunctional glycosyltransferase family 2 protein/CDP-glycerol:glycerophosphate glycerophosphotransferase [Eubacterium sp.]
MVSIIVTHKQCLWYLEDCLKSIAGQEFKDYETILVVDDLQDEPEEFQKIIDEYQEKIHLSVFYLEEKTGVSAARNLGLDKAQGEYIYFLDNDDYIYEDGIKKLLDVMEEDTDMAYGRVQGTYQGTVTFEEKRNLEKEEERLSKYDFYHPLEAKFTHYRRLENLTILGAVYRKSLFERNNIRFNEEQLCFADVLVLTKIMCSTDKIIGNIDAIYVKRHHNDRYNNPAIEQTPKIDSMPYYFMAVDNAKEIAKGHKEIERHLDLILAKFTTLYLIKKLRWNTEEEPCWKEEYFSELHERLKNVNLRHLNRKYIYWLEKSVMRAVATGNLEKTKKAGNRLLAKRKIKRMFKNKWARNKAFALHIFNKMEIKKDWVIFESFMGRNYSGQPKYIYEYMQKHYGDKYTYIWSVDKRGLKIPGKHKTVKRSGLRYFYYMNRSKYWILNMKQPLSVPKREETILLETWHGTPLKRLAFDLNDVVGGVSNYKDKFYRQKEAWDYLLSDNPFSTEKFQSCFMYPKEKILEYGYPANDPLYAPDREERAKKIKEKLGIPLDKKVIMYAPTWRDDNYYEIGQFKFDLDLDVNRLEKEFGDEYVILLRLHYLVVEALDMSKYGDFAVNGSAYDDVTDLYLITDILITDYSSVFFDFANLKRPVLYYTYDLERYRDVLHGFYLSMEDDLPGPMLLTNNDVVDAIKNIDKIEEQYKDRYEEFYNRFCCVDDGHASERVVKKIFGE